MTDRPALHQAISLALDAKQQAHDETTRPERERIAQQAAADAKLMGTPAWDALSGFRKARATHHATQPVTGDDTATQHAVALAQGGGNDAA